MAKRQQRNPDEHTEYESKAENHRGNHGELSPRESDFVKVVVRVLGVFIGASLALAISSFFAGQRPITTWFVALTAVLFLGDLEIYWTHSLSHPHELSVMAELWCAGLVLFCIFGVFESWFAVGTLPQPIAQASFPLSVPSPPPTFKFDLRAPIGPITVAFGGNQYHTFGIPMLIDGQRPFTLEFGENGRLICNVNIYSIGSKQIIRIEHNEIKELPDGWKTNANDNGMEIVDDTLRPVFQMYYEAPTVIRIQGIVIVGGLVMLMNEDWEQDYPINSPDLPEAIKHFSLPRFFKYPREMFPGVPN